MKKTWVYLFAVIIAALMVLPAQAASDKKAKDAKDPVVKIGVIDMQRILRESKAAKMAVDVYRKDLEEKRGVVAAKQKEIQAMEEELKGADAAKLTDDARREKADKMARDVRELKLLTADMDTDLKRKDAELSQKVFGEVVKLVNDYAKKENITMVVNRMAVVALDETMDITSTIIKLYDAGK